MTLDVDVVPELPAGSTGADRLLRALLESFPEAVWSPNAPLRITAHSRASDLRRLGWDVRCVHRPSRVVGKLEYGYVLRHTPQVVAQARAKSAPSPSPRFDDDLVSIDVAAQRVGFSVDELRSMDRRRIIPSDVTIRGKARYLGTTVARLEAVGALVSIGVPVREAAARVVDQPVALAAQLRHAAAALEVRA